MKKEFFGGRIIPLGGVIAAFMFAFAASPAMAAVDTSACSAPPLSQPFSGANDFNWYAYTPGESADSFTAEGWTLSAGASIVPTQLGDGASGSVLDLTSGATAVSPVMCISTDYPNAKAMIQRLAGSGGVNLLVSYEDSTGTWSNPKAAGALNPPASGWGVSNQIGLQVPKASGWQMVQFTFQAPKAQSEFQVYDLGMQADATAAANSVDTSACTPPSESQYFLSAGDSNWYALAPGESGDGFDGTGWTMTGGAQVVQTQLPDGSTGLALNLPTGSQAVSPVMCVTSDYPEARAYGENLNGSGGGVGLFVAYDGTKTWGNPQHTGDMNTPGKTWSLSGMTSIKPGNQAGWQLVQFTLKANGSTGNYQVWEFAVDPRCRG